MAGVSFLSDSEIQSIRELLEIPHLEVIIRSSWGSENPEHREFIHGELKKKMAKAYPFSDSSISHTHLLGGFAFSQFDSNHVIQIGFDIEEDNRVSEPVARRICKTEQEFLNAPSSASLWAAKEAAFKALKGKTQPSVVSQIELVDWQQPRSQFETVQVSAPKFYSFSRIKGVLYKKSGFTFAFFASTP